MSIGTSKCEFGWKAKNFELLSIDEKFYKLDDLRGVKGTLIAFICNHCPYVKAIANRLSYESNELKKIGITTIGIMSNDVVNYPEDSFENMKLFAKEYNFKFPYLFDEFQYVAKSYKAICTPDFFGFNKLLELQYRGRIDSGIMNSNLDNIKRELFNAMKLISETGNGPEQQNSSMGCSIKWKKND